MKFKQGDILRLKEGIQNDVLRSYETYSDLPEGYFMFTREYEVKGLEKQESNVVNYLIEEVLDAGTPRIRGWIKASIAEEIFEFSTSAASKPDEFKKDDVLVIKKGMHKSFLDEARVRNWLPEDFFNFDLKYVVTFSIAPIVAGVDSVGYFISKKDIEKIFEKDSPVECVNPKIAFLQETDKNYKKSMEMMNDPVNSPSHYTQGIECIDYIESHKMNFSQGNAIKYITRYQHKNGLEDLKKARWYVDRMIKELEEKNV